MVVLRLLIFIFCLLPVLTGATTYYVTKSGNDGNNGLTPGTALLTVQLGLDSADNYHDTLLIGAGVYDEVSPFDGWDPAVNAGFRPHNDSVTIKGYLAIPELRGSQTADSLRVGMYLDGRQSIIVDSVKIVKGYRAAIRAGGISRNIIAKNCVFDSTGQGSSGDNNGAIWTYTNDQPDVVGLQIINCTFTNTWTSDAGTGGNAAHIMLYACDSCLIQGNTFSLAPDNIRLKGPFNAQNKDTSLYLRILDNVCFDFSHVGINLGNQGQYLDIICMDNLIYSGPTYPGQAGISIRDAAVNDSTYAWGNTRTYVINNTIDCKGVMGGIYIKAAWYNASTGTFYTDSTYLLNNIIVNAKGGSAGNVDQAIAILSAEGESSNGEGAMGYADYDHNHIYDTTTAEITHHHWDTLANNFWTLPEWRDNTAWGDNTTTGNPLFTGFYVATSDSCRSGTSIDGLGHNWKGWKEPPPAPRRIFKGWKP